MFYLSYWKYIRSLYGDLTPAIQIHDLVIISQWVDFHHSFQCWSVTGASRENEYSCLVAAGRVNGNPIGMSDQFHLYVKLATFLKQITWELPRTYDTYVDCFFYQISSYTNYNVMQVCVSYRLLPSNHLSFRGCSNQLSIIWMMCLILCFLSITFTIFNKWTCCNSWLHVTA